MHARKKLNALYTVVAVLVAAYAGLAFDSWWGFGVAFALLMMFNTHAGNTRWAATRRR